MSKNYFLAFDLGASSGRAMLGTLEDTDTRPFLLEYFQFV
jgi:sugar (pentulose or hexulose) kinase